MGIKRHEGNPILKKEDVPFKVNSIFNPGAVKIDGKYILLCRVEMPVGRSSFVLASSDDGISLKVGDKPCLTPGDHNDYHKYVEWGIEDARVVKIGDKFYMTYTGYSRYMPLVMIAETEDFKTYKMLRPISEPSNKDFFGKLIGLLQRVEEIYG
jgi:beta-1,2-mannobiose phosphorylase / 1,2-beta-oligomannan phosphorylase